MLFKSILAATAYFLVAVSTSTKPNIVFLLTDDQDIRLGSLEYQNVVQRLLIQQGVSFTNHHVTTAVCCPSRATLLKGQLAHNTNITHVRSPGGDYEKWILAKQDEEYMPQLMKKAGYRTEYIGKFLNGYSLFNYDTPPKGWDHVDGLMDPYNAAFNTVVMSKNGGVPMHYPGYHQTDVIRAKALDRLEYLTNQKDPWLLFLAPTSPHVDNGKKYVEPLARYWDDSEDVKAPRQPHWNPDQKVQNQKSYWIKNLPPMNETQIEWADMSYRRRIQSLRGIDEIIEDSVKYLESKGEMNNTYFIYTSDNGYHVGQFRSGAGKSTPYADDSNVPLVIRGPGIKPGLSSTLPGTHTDLLPTLLDIAKLQKNHWPAFLDGRSLLPQWKKPHKRDHDAGLGIAKEIINIEHWGFGTIEAPAPDSFFPTSTYKTIRLAGDGIGWLYVMWCTGEAELYDILADPYEMANLINSTESRIKETINRFNALVLYMKSCGASSCQDPWGNFHLPKHLKPIKTFKQAMQHQYDSFFAQFPTFTFAECMDYQYAPNETPFYPPESISLGSQFRQRTDNYVLTLPKTWIKANAKPAGGWDQRHVTISKITETARYITKEEIFGPGKVERREAYEMELVGDANGS
ncbi:arylsulfatase precursor [Fusarium coicis]|nr:arylsulfatase precursor [Fusarium coicis]